MLIRVIYDFLNIFFYKGQHAHLAQPATIGRTMRITLLGTALHVLLGAQLAHHSWHPGVLAALMATTST